MSAKAFKVIKVTAYPRSMQISKIESCCNDIKSLKFVTKLFIFDICEAPCYTS